MNCVTRPVCARAAPPLKNSSVHPLPTDRCHALDRFLANLPSYNRQQVRLMLAQRRVRVDGKVASDPLTDVREFSRVELDEQLLQAGRPARYLMLYKPTGCVSATHDPQHRTVLDLLPTALRDDLHIAGRLDFNTTGLMILTNDGQWSRRLTQPATKLPKHYLVDTEDEIGEHYVPSFARVSILPSKTSPPNQPSWRSSAPTEPGWRSSRGGTTRSSACSGTSTTRWWGCIGRAWERSGWIRGWRRGSIVN